MYSRRSMLRLVAASPLLWQARRLLAQPGTDATSLGLAEASALIRKGELSPLELTQAYLRRIIQYQGSINA